MKNKNNECIINNEYKPETVSHPGETLREKLEEMGMDVYDFSEAAQIELELAAYLLIGEASFTSSIAKATEKVTGIPARFWQDRQFTYDDNQEELRAKKAAKKTITSLTLEMKEQLVKDRTTKPKPPIGLVPEKIFYEEVVAQRFRDVKDAIARYVAADIPVPSEWISEYNTLANEKHLFENNPIQK